MNALPNKVQLIGNLGMTPEIKILNGGKKIAQMSIATNESYRNSNDELIKETQWHNLIARGEKVDIIEKNFKKGSKIAIEGKLIKRNYMDKDGLKRYVTEIHISDFLMHSGNNA